MSLLRLHGVLVTYRRPEELAVTLGRIRAQTRQLDTLVVIDNASDPATGDLLDDYPGTTQHLDPGDNLGPAGGYALGMSTLLDTAADDDWIILLDDDNPPFFDDAFEGIARFATQILESEPLVGGVGLSGGRFDLRTGRVVRVGDSEIRGAVPVDHITGGGVPAYRVGAVRQVGVPAANLFFGFEELEYGLRLTAAGRPLFADGERWAQRKAAKRDIGLLPPEEVSAARASSVSIEVGEPSWRRYYSLRNLIHVLRLNHATWTAFRISWSRGIIKPLVNIVARPGPAWAHLKLNTRAILDAWRGRMGRTMEPGP